MPFYTCDCPREHRGEWTRLRDGLSMGEDFDATALPPNERKGYRYQGPEIIYVFWAKHGPCQVTINQPRSIICQPTTYTRLLSTSLQP